MTEREHCEHLLNELRKIRVGDNIKRTYTKYSFVLPINPILAIECISYAKGHVEIIDGNIASVCNFYTNEDVGMLLHHIEKRLKTLKEFKDNYYKQD